MKIAAALMLVLATSIAGSPAPTSARGDPSGRFIALPDDPTEGLIVPPDSPVQFRAYGEYGRAQFDGRFVLSGTYAYGCAIDCDGPDAEQHFRFDIIPDPEIFARLPRWKKHSGDMMITVWSEERLVRALTTRWQRAALRSGKLNGVHGRITIVVEQFDTGLDCDSANYAARFVAFARAPKLARTTTEPAFGGCG